MVKKIFGIVLMVLMLALSPALGGYCDSSWQYEANATSLSADIGDTVIFNTNTNNYANQALMRCGSTYTRFVPFVPETWTNGWVINAANWTYHEYYEADNKVASASIYNCYGYEFGEANITGTWGSSNHPTCTNVSSYSSLADNTYTPDNWVTLDLTDVLNYNLTDLNDGHSHIWVAFGGCTDTHAASSMEDSSSDHWYWCYNASTPIYNTEINLSSPINDTYTTSDIWINFTGVNDVLTEFPCYYYLDDVEYSIGNQTNDTEYGILQEDVSGGSHDVYAKCMNSDGSYSETDRVYFLIDEPPTSEFIEAQTDYSLNNSNVEFTVMVNDSVDSSLQCVICDDTESTCFSAFNMLNNSLTVKPYGGFSDGLHEMSINCTDSFGSSDVDYLNLSISQGTYTACFYTYDDYNTYITNNSLFWEGRQLKPDAVRDIVLFNDSLGKVWTKQEFDTIQDKWQCTNLIDGCASFTFYATGNYQMWLADNVDFNDECEPTINQPRYYEKIGKIYFKTGENVTDSYHVDFEKDITSFSEDGFTNFFVQAMIGVALLGACFAGFILAMKTMSGIVGVATLIALIGTILWFSQMIGGLF